MSQQENIYELPLFKAHVLLLADIVADFSGRTELAKKGKVKELFLRQVKTAPVPDAAELQAAAETSTDAVLERALKRKEQQEFEVQLSRRRVRLISTRPSIRICVLAARL